MVRPVPDPYGDRLRVMVPWLHAPCSLHRRVEGHYM